MITRISINGFKSLVNVEVFLGTFTCIAGRNAVGKSNLFDALVFLSNLADKPLLEAAKLVRSEGQKHTNIRDIFQKIGNNYTDTISFEIDMIVPSTTIDDLGQKAEATITSLRYSLELYYNDIENEDPIKIKKEELVPIPLLEARKSIKFPHTNEWLKSCI
ncbi:MAG: AAA family ATPase, partial [Emticicia sp.]